MHHSKKFSERAEQIEGYKVQFIVWIRPSKKGNPARIMKCVGKILRADLNCVVIQGINIPGLYNRPLTAIEVMA